MSDLISNSPIMMEKFSTTLDQLVKTVEASKHKIHYHAYFVYQLQVLKHRFTASNSSSSNSHVATTAATVQHSASSHNRMSLGISSLFRKFIPGGSSATNTSTPSMQLTQPTMNIQQPSQPQVIAPQQQVVQPQPQVQPQQQQVQQQVQQPQPSPTSKQEKRSDSASLWSKLNPFKRTASSSSPKADGSNARSANMGESNKLYYNEEIKRWIPIGADPKDYIEELPPPPPETLSTSSSSVDTPSAMMMMSSTSLTDSYSGSSKYVGFGFATTATPNPSTTGSATPPVPPMATSNTTSSNPSPYPTQFFMPPMNTSQPPAFFMPSANAAVSNEAAPAYSSGYEIPQFVPSFQPTSQEQPPPQQ